MRARFPSAKPLSPVSPFQVIPAQLSYRSHFGRHFRSKNSASRTSGHKILSPGESFVCIKVKEKWPFLNSASRICVGFRIQPLLPSQVKNPPNFTTFQCLLRASANRIPRILFYLTQYNFNRGC